MVNPFLWLPSAQLSSSTQLPDLQEQNGTKLNKKRKYVRGAAKPNLKRQKLSLDNCSSDEAAEIFASEGDSTHAHPLYDEEYAEQHCPPQGVKWITNRIPQQLMPNGIQVSDEQATANWKESLAMFHHINEKCRPMNE